jgi:ABC-2 type transport system ATP-binding protein
MKDNNKDVILEVKDLHKHYGELKAVNGTSFQVERGICFGLLGPNGAGKSTTIECIEMITQKTSGDILFNGEPFKESTLEKIGVQFQETALPPKLKVGETLEFFSKLYANEIDIDELIKECSLDEYLNQFHDQISGGQRQRLLLAVSLCHNPKLVLLDEPTTGLDPQARRNLWDLVRKIKSRGTTIILTTHYMEEAFELCDEIGIMDHGKLIALGTPKNLLSEHFKNVVIEIPNSSQKIECSEEVIQAEHYVEIHTENLNKTLEQLTAQSIDLTGMNIRQSNLEDLFLQLTGKELRK